MRKFLAILSIISLNSTASEITIDADKSEIFPKLGEYQFSKNVVLTMDEGFIKSEHLRILKPNNVTKSITATGNEIPVIFSLKDISGSTKNLNINLLTNKVSLLKESKLVTKDIEVIAHEILYDLSTQTLTTPQHPDHRVRYIIK
jgi:lipopolysaccharide transport protein LptA